MNQKTASKKGSIAIRVETARSCRPCRQPRIAGQVLELGAQQVGDDGHVGGGRVALGARLCGLDLTVHGFDEVVAQPAAEMLDDPGKVRQHGRAEHLERCQSAATRP